MQKRLKILVSAYACSPNRGSEPGMGWNFVLGLRQFHEVHVIVEKRKWKAPIDEFLKEHPALRNNLKFYFIDKKRNKLLRKLWPPSYYWFYKQWQKAAFQLALELDNKEEFDIVHQLNMVGFREPGYLWKINKPFVWGPIGGLENSPWRFLPSLGIKGAVFYTGRNLMNWGQRRFLNRPRKAAKRSNTALIAATSENAQFIKELWGKDAVVISEVGQETNVVFSSNERNSNENLKIVWSGLHIPRKNLLLLLNALKDVDFNFELHIMGTGEMTGKWRKLANSYGLKDRCIWYGFLGREEALDVMKKGHVFCITSISDLTSTVTLEALSYGLPIVCLDHCGFSNVVTENCGIKIPVDTPKEAAVDFAKALSNLYNDEPYRQRLSTGALHRAEDFNWKNKIKQLNAIYSDLLNNVNE